MGAVSESSLDSVWLVVLVHHPSLQQGALSSREPQGPQGRSAAFLVGIGRPRGLFTGASILREAAGNSGDFDKVRGA